MIAEETDDLTLMPDGRINAPYILANAQLLYRSEEYELAASLFRVVRGHPKLGHCAEYGLGICWLAQGDFEKSRGALVKAMQIQPQAYIALAMLEAMLACGQFEEVERATLKYVKDFGQKYDERFRRIHQIAVQRQMST